MMASIRIGTAPPLDVGATNVNFASPSAVAQTVAISGGTPSYSVSGRNGVANTSVNGGSLSLSPVSVGSCVLTIADSSTPSITSNLTLTVAAPSPVLTLAPTVISFASATSASQNVTTTGGTPRYAVSGCTGIAAGTVTAQNLQVVPQAVGTYSFVVTDASGNQTSLNVSINAAASGSALDNITFHKNTARQGWYQNERIRTTANVASTAFGQHGAALRVRRQHAERRPASGLYRRRRE